MRVALINMPFASLYRPSIGLSLLQSGLQQNSIHCDVFYLNFLFASMIGVEQYDYMVEGALPQAAFPGEWTFSESLYGRDNFSEYKEYLETSTAFRNPTRREEYFERVVTIKQHVEDFLERCLSAADWDSYDVIGFTSVFEQHVASLSFAKRLKEKFPSKFVIFGGANCEGGMGQTLLQEFSFVDAVCSGEGDISFVSFLSEWNTKGRLDPSATPKGITLRSSEQPELCLLTPLPTSSQPVHDMDGLPYPNYDDYFAQFTEQGFHELERTPRFLFESSRGCWWGAKSHCNFCGLNGSNMSYRSKSADRALEELLYLRERYGAFTSKASAVDNIIDMQYFKDFLPKIRDMQLNLDMFYETKANLTKDQVRLFHDAGFNFIQPGIESLITSTLRLMRKGISMLQNVQLLKWCKEYNVFPYWNFLYGFPNEDESEYRKIPDIIQSLTHLVPPGSIGRIRLDRFSPYFDNAADHGIINVRPMRAYHLVYQDQSEEALMNMAYYFEFDYADDRKPDSYTRELFQEAIKWQETHAQSELFHVDLGEHLVIVDLRDIATENMIKLSGLEKTLYLLCDNLRSIKTLCDHLQKHDIPHSDEQVQRILDRFLEQKLMLTESGVYLSLSIPLGTYQPKKKGLEKLMELSNALKAVEAGA